MYYNTYDCENACNDLIMIVNKIYKLFFSLSICLSISKDSPSFHSPLFIINFREILLLKNINF